MDQRGERRRRGRAVLADRIGRATHVLGQHGRRAGPDEGRAAGDHLVAEGADRVDIGALVGTGVGGGLLGRHVGGRAERHAERRERGAAGGLGDRLGDAEVGHEGMLAREQHVVGLHVAVHDAVRVGVRERVAHVAQDPHRLADRQLVLLHEPGAQRLPLHAGHDVVEEVAVRARGEQRNDMGMLQLGGELDLALEPLRAHARGHLGREHLHHHLPAEPHLLSEEHTAHAATAELGLEVVRVS